MTATTKAHDFDWAVRYPKAQGHLFPSLHLIGLRARERAKERDRREKSTGEEREKEPTEQDP